MLNVTGEVSNKYMLRTENQMRFSYRKMSYSRYRVVNGQPIFSWRTPGCDYLLLARHNSHSVLSLN